MSVLVTGGTGFLGAHVVRFLLEKGERKVIAFDLFPNERNLADVLDKVEIVRGDLGKFSNVLRLVQTHKPESIYHIGAMLAPACDGDPEAGIQANALGTYYILEAARLFCVPQVVFASSISVLSAANPNDQTVNDYSSARPETVYGAAKLFSENLGLFYRRQHGLDYRGLRLPALIGPGTMSHGYAEYFNKVIEESAKGNPYVVYVEPRNRIPVVHIKDAARAFADLRAAPQERIKTVNYIVIGPTPTPSALELVDLVKTKIPGAKIGFKVNENIQKIMDQSSRLPFDDRYARQEWGWRHEYDLDAIVDDFLAQTKRLAVA
jgi:threonine 3-dehydrogenase